MKKTYLFLVLFSFALLSNDLFATTISDSTKTVLQDSLQTKSDSSLVDKNLESVITPRNFNSPYLSGQLNSYSPLFNPKKRTGGNVAFKDYGIQPEVWRPAKPVNAEVDARGDLGLNIPITTVPGLNGLDFPIALNYNHNIIYLTIHIE